MQILKQNNNNNNIKTNTNTNNSNFTINNLFRFLNGTSDVILNKIFFKMLEYYVLKLCPYKFNFKVT
jgi:hypothetical protein